MWLSLIIISTSSTATIVTTTVYINEKLWSNFRIIIQRRMVRLLFLYGSLSHVENASVNILNPFYYRHNLHIIPQPASLYCINPDNYSQANVSFSALHIQFFNDDPCYYFVVAVQRWLMTVCRCRYGIQIPSTRLHSVGQLVAIVLRSFNFFWQM